MKKTKSNNILERCIVCDKKRFNELEETLWQSDIIIQNYLNKNSDIKITICPECRELPLNQILTKVIQNQFEET